MELSLDGNDGEGEELILASNSLSEFKAIDFGDYRLSVEIVGEEGASFNNRLVTLNQGQSKAIILYRYEEDELTSISFEESALPQVYDHQIQIADLAPEFYDLDFYFVRKDEAIETAEYKKSGLDYEESKSITLPSDFYELIAVYDDNEDTQVLLDRTELLGINQVVNYIISVEKNVNSATGYSIPVLH